MVWTITWREDSGRVGKQVLREGSFVLGAGKGCDVLVFGEGVAERHVQIHLQAGGLKLEHLGTRQVTLLNGAVLTGVAEAEGTLTLLLGSVLLEFEPTEFALENDLPPVCTRGKQASVGFSYELKRQVAEGGMASVYLGGDPLLSREVAVKISAGEAGGGAEAVVAEAQILARLEHPNIMPVYAIGTNEAGAPFYSMKLVKGRSLQDVLDQLIEGNAETTATHTLDRLLTVFGKACDGIAFAHAKGFLHRDLKPQNLMLGEYGEVLLIDWGLAQEMEDSQGQEKRAPASALDLGVIEGSPQYMAPEQVLGEALDERCDIYALGGILYALLTWRVPVSGKSLVEVLAKVSRGEVRPLTHWERADHARLRGHAHEVPLALKAVVLKAMSLNREDRYRSVQELVRDVEFYQHGFATSAEHAGMWRLLVLLVRRNQGVAAMVAILFAAGIAFTFSLAASERGARESARVAREQMRIAQEQRGLAELNALRAAEHEKQAVMEKELARRTGAKSQLGVAEAAYRELNGEATKTALAQIPEDLRADSWAYLNQKLDTADITIDAKGGNPFSAAAPDPREAGVYFTLQHDGWVRSLNVNTGQTRDLFQVEPGTRDGRFYPDAWSLAVSSDGAMLAIGRVFRQKKSNNQSIASLSTYRSSDGEKIAGFSLNESSNEDRDRRLLHLTFSPDGCLLLGGFPRSVKIWNAQTGELQWKTDANVGLLRSWMSTPEVFSTDSSRVLIPKGQEMWEADAWSGSILLKHRKIAGNLAWQYLAPGWSSHFALRNGILGFYQGLDAEPKWQLPYSGLSAFSIGRNSIGGGYLPKGELLVTAVSFDSKEWAVLHLLDGKTGTTLRSELCLGDGLRFTGGPQLVTDTRTNEAVVLMGTKLKIWRFAPPSPTRTLHVQNGSRSLNAFQFLGNSRWALKHTSTKGIQSLELLDLNDPQAEAFPTFVYRSPTVSRYEQITASEDGRTIAISGGLSNQFVEVLKREEDRLVLAGSWQAQASAHRLSISEDGEKLWTGDALYHPLTGGIMARFDTALTAPGHLNSNSSSWLGPERFAEVTSIKNKESTNSAEIFLLGVALWNVDSSSLEQFAPSPNAVCLGSSPDGGFLVEGGADQRIRIRNARTLELVSEFRGHDAEVVGALWHPKLSLLVTLSVDHTVKIWNSRTCALVETLRIGASRPTQLSLSPDGEAVTVHTINGELHLWHPASFQQ